MGLGPSEKARAARHSPIRSMTVECDRLGGVNLAQGVCDTPIPEAVRRAAHEAIDAGANTYSRFDGLEELRLELAAKMRRDNRLDYDPESEILVTSGATGAFYVAALALLDPGDEVVLFEPYYGYHLDTLSSLDVTPVFVTLPRPDWSFRVQDLEAAITPRTRAIVINTPVNPSGKVFSRAELEGLGQVAERHDLFLMTDEVYEHFVFDGCEHVSPASLPGLRERTITINALSKTFAVTGWRVGWMAACAPPLRCSSPRRGPCSSSAPSTTRGSAASISPSGIGSATRSRAPAWSRTARTARTSRWPTFRDSLATRASSAPCIFYVR